MKLLKIFSVRTGRSNESNQIQKENSAQITIHERHMRHVPEANVRLLPEIRLDPPQILSAFHVVIPPTLYFNHESYQYQLKGTLQCHCIVKV